MSKVTHLVVSPRLLAGLEVHNSETGKNHPPDARPSLPPDSGHAVTASRTVTCRLLIQRDSLREKKWVFCSLQEAIQILLKNPSFHFPTPDRFTPGHTLQLLSTLFVP